MTFKWLCQNCKFQSAFPSILRLLLPVGCIYKHDLDLFRLCVQALHARTPLENPPQSAAQAQDVELTFFSGPSYLLAFDEGSFAIHAVAIHTCARTFLLA